MSAAPPEPKLRVLCLHGYLQNAEVFRGRIGSLRKALKARAEFLFVDAPHLAQGEEAELRAAGGTADHPRSWWNWEDLEQTKRPSKAVHYTGWEASLKVLHKALRTEHIDGVLGFSQGATATALLLADLAQRTGSAPALKFAILVSGFLPKDDAFAGTLAAAKVSTPSMFIHGEKDELVPLERCQELQQTFDPQSCSLLTHPGGHFVPNCTGAVKQQLVDFLSKF